MVFLNFIVLTVLSGANIFLGFNDPKVIGGDIAYSYVKNTTYDEFEHHAVLAPKFYRFLGDRIALGNDVYMFLDADQKSLPNSVSANTGSISWGADLGLRYYYMNLKDKKGFISVHSGELWDGRSYWETGEDRQFEGGPDWIPNVEISHLIRAGTGVNIFLNDCAALEPSINYFYRFNDMMTQHKVKFHLGLVYYIKHK